MIYFLQSVEPNVAEGPIKIGYTDNDLRERVADLQVGNPYLLRVLGVIPSGTKDQEYRLHQMFAEYRLQGEWFTPRNGRKSHSKSYNRLTQFIRRYTTGYVWGAEAPWVLPGWLKVAE